MGRFRLPGTVSSLCVAVVAALSVPAPPAAAAPADTYLITIKDTAAPSAESTRTAHDLTTRHGGTVTAAYRYALNGFAARLTPAQARTMAADARVAMVERDTAVHAMDTQLNPPSWGLDRIDQRDLPLSGSYSYDTTASNVTGYVIDTGIRTTHATFGGRARWGTNTTGDGVDSDCNGHGTHVAGTLGGNEYGVAKGVALVAVKVLTCQGSGTTAGVVAGVDWVAGQHQAGVPAVANMSLGGSANATLDAAVRGAIADGVSFAVPSGGSNSDACNFSPARVAEAITVNASDTNDARASSSNYGPCTDLFAPGVTITSAWHTSDTASQVLSGSSMAAPHAAGAAALHLAGNPAASPAAVHAALLTNATPDKITNPGAGTPNRLLYTAPGSQTGPTVANPGDQTGVMGKATSLQLSATGGTAPYTWTATGLPPGLSINTETGLISGTPSQWGSYQVTATATDTAGRSGSASFRWQIVTPPVPCQRDNGTDYPIRDFSTVESPITVSGCPTSGLPDSRVEVHIKHTYIGDLVVSLVSPDGTVFVLHNRTGGGTDNLDKTYTVNLSGEYAEGTWKLRVRDAARFDTGYIDSWRIAL
ncbi:MAG: S8 family peptidase [Micromonosporaceae bacterium]